MLTKYNVFSIALLAVSLLSLLTLLVRGGSRLKFSELEAAMKEGQKKDDDALIEIE